MSSYICVYIYIYSKALAGCAADPRYLDWREYLYCLCRSGACKGATVANFGNKAGAYGFYLKAFELYDGMLADFSIKPCGGVLVDFSINRVTECSPTCSIRPCDGFFADFQLSQVTEHSPIFQWKPCDGAR